MKIAQVEENVEVDVEDLMNSLEQVENEASNLRAELERSRGHQHHRDLALIRAVRMVQSVQMAISPIAVAPGPGSSGGAAATPVTTKCPYCSNNLSITVTK